MRSACFLLWPEKYHNKKAQRDFFAIAATVIFVQTKNVKGKIVEDQINICPQN